MSKIMPDLLNGYEAGLVEFPFTEHHLGLEIPIGKSPSDFSERAHASNRAVVIDFFISFVTGWEDQGGDASEAIALIRENPYTFGWWLAMFRRLSGIAPFFDLSNAPIARFAGELALENPRPVLRRNAQEIEVRDYL